MPQTAHAGSLVAGRYRIDGLLGEGGFATVYRAVHVDMGRHVALKVLHAHLLGSSYVDKRFMREAELARRLQHPNTVRLLDFGRDADGSPFLAYEWLDGETLAELVAREGALEPTRVKRIGAQILKSMLEAHGMGIVHRDIKPQNVFMARYPGETDFVKVLDFGIAKAPPDEQEALTRAGAMIGTPSYMAPEQVRGSGVGPATDLYALGLVLAECLSGQRVVRATSNALIALEQSSERQVPLTPEVIRSPLGPVILRATQKALERRFQSAGEMLALLENVHTLGATPVSAPPPVSAPLPTAPGLPPTQGWSAPPVAATVAQPAATMPEAPRPQRAPVALIVAAVAAFAAVVTLAVVFGPLLLADEKRAETDEPKRKKTARSAAPPPAPAPAPPPPQPRGPVATFFDDHDTLHRKLAQLGWTLDGHQANKGNFATNYFDQATKGGRFVTLSLFRFLDQRGADNTIASMLTGGSPGAYLLEGVQLLVATEATGDEAIARDLIVQLTGQQPTLIRRTANP
jgi:hypothetical protein